LYHLIVEESRNPVDFRAAIGDEVVRKSYRLDQFY